MVANLLAHSFAEQDSTAVCKITSTSESSVSIRAVSMCLPALPIVLIHRLTRTAIAGKIAPWTLRAFTAASLAGLYGE